MSAPPNLIAVQSNVAASMLIDGLFDEAVARLGAELPGPTECALGQAADAQAARLGYLARVIELERFAVARAPVPWLVERAVARPDDSMAELAAALAAKEPLQKSSPADGSPLWQIPGPGGHVRHYLALRAIDGVLSERKRSWLSGFFLRCCEDTGNRLAPIGPP